jgi:ATP-dependent protease ClpP protease subunit
LCKGVALQLEYTEPQTELERLFGGFRSINAFGRIESDDAERFLKFLESVQPPPRTCVYINSTGGDVDAAIVIGIFIRKLWLLTSIGSYVLCSADGLGLLLGVNLFPENA